MKASRLGGVVVMTIVLSACGHSVYWQYGNEDNSTPNPISPAMAAINCSSEETQWEANNDDDPTAAQAQQYYLGCMHSETHG